MNILIPLGKGSTWENNELRYCLRGIVKHLTGWNQIVIIGEKPSWLKPDYRLLHVSFPEKPSAINKEKNIHLKIMFAIEKRFVKNNFLFMNDDHFLLHDFQAPLFPDYHKGRLSPAGLPDNSNYRKTILNTLKQLHSKWIPEPLHFDTHCPIIYNCETYVKHLGGLSWPNFGYCIKSMYGNLEGLKGEYYPDLKTGVWYSGTNQELKDRLYFSTSAKSCNEHLKTYLEECYPVKAVWEK